MLVLSASAHAPRELRQNRLPKKALVGWNATPVRSLRCRYSCTVCSTAGHVGHGHVRTDELAALPVLLTVVAPLRERKMQVYAAPTRKPPPYMVTFAPPEADPLDGRFRPHEPLYARSAEPDPPYATAWTCPIHDPVVSKVTFTRASANGHGGSMQTTDDRDTAARLSAVVTFRLPSRTSVKRHP